jgi:hypothetical protein
VMQNMFWFRRRIVGTFQISGVPTVDAGVPFQFYSGSILGFGRPRDVVAAVDGRPAIVPVVTLTICVDHVAMDGMRAATLLNAIIAVLESDELVREAEHAVEESQSAASGLRALPAASLPAAASGS